MSMRQRYNAAGVMQGGEFRVNSYTTELSAGAGGCDGRRRRFRRRMAERRQDGSDYGIYAQRYNAAGVAQGTEFRVNTLTTAAQLQPSAAMNADGDFVVTWVSNVGVSAQRYNSAGAALGTEFRVNTSTAYAGQPPSAAMKPTATSSLPGAAADGDSDGVFAQRYTTFGPASAATVGDRVWNDSNANGIQDAGEAGIAGARVELSSASGAGVASVSTSAAGQYSFPVLAGTSAFLHFVTPAGFLTTHQNRGSDDGLDSDADRVTGLTPVFTTGAAGTTNTSLDAGFCLPGSVGGVAFNDRSGDGIRNGGEEALAGFHVFLDLDGDGVPDVNEPNGPTDIAGDYHFGNLLGDTYRLGIVDQVQWVEPALSPFLVLPDATTPINLALRTSAPDSIRTGRGRSFASTPSPPEVQSPRAAMDADGDFVVAGAAAGRTADGGIFAQRYNAAGVAAGRRVPCQHDHEW